MVPSIALDAPRFVTTNNGRIPKIISVEKSVKKLTNPNATTFRIPDWSRLGKLLDKVATYLIRNIKDVKKGKMPNQSVANQILTMD